MATSTSNMRLSGGHAALDLANTVDSRRGRWGPDFLRSFDDILVLAERTALVDEATVSILRATASARSGRANAALAQTVALREAVYQVFLNEEAGCAVQPSMLHIIEDAAREGRSRARLQRLGLGFAWRLPFDELDDIVRAFAIAAVDLLMARGTRRDVRECKGDNCGWLFLDHSKGGHRIWCSDATCGTRSRIARFRTQPKKS